MYFTNSVYFKEESVLSGLLGRFPSRSFIIDELNEIAGFLRFDPRFDVFGLWRGPGHYPKGLSEFVLPAVFLSMEKPIDTFLVERENRHREDINPDHEAGIMPVRREKRLGEYSHTKNLITLYIPNIESKDMTVEELKVYLSMVLSHELFHAFQHYVAPEKSKKYKKNAFRGNAIDETVKVMESTADFFAFLWLTERSKHHGTGLEDQLRGDRFDAWMGEDVDLWPYAGAKYCVRDELQKRIYDRMDLHRFDQSADRFTEVLESFVNDGDPIDRTYDILIQN